MQTYLSIVVCIAVLLHTIGTITANEELAKQFRNVAFGVLSIVCIFIGWMTF